MIIINIPNIKIVTQNILDIGIYITKLGLAVMGYRLLYIPFL